MQPDLIFTPFAENAPSGNVDYIPDALSPSDPPQSASWEQGFPSVTMTPLAAGGIPPRGQSFNGVFKSISEHIVFLGGGGQYKWSQEFVTRKGGYPKGSVIQSDDGLSSYVSAVDGNTINFNSAPGSIGVQWLKYAGNTSIPDSSETQKGIIQLATSAESISGINTTKAITPAALAAKTANSARIGLIQIASIAEVQAGTDFTKAVTPVTLFQCTATELRTGIASLATAAEVQSGANASKIVTPATLNSRTATESRTGIVELATVTETIAMTDGTRAVTPLGLASIASSVASVSGSSGNLRLSSTGLSSLVSVSADAVVLSSPSNVPVQVRNVALSINSSSSGANGLDSGVLQQNTWYAVHLIWNGSTVSGLLSLSASAPTLPSGYTHRARVGWIRTDGTANMYPLSFTQAGRRASWKVAAGSNVATSRVMAAGAAGSISVPTWVALAVDAFVPPTATDIYLTLGTTGGNTVMAAPSAAYGARSNVDNPAPAYIEPGSGGAYATVPFRFLLESANIYWAGSNSNARVICSGWEDNL